MEDNLKKYISELIQEIEKDIDESTTSGNVSGYSTPKAFSDNGSKDKKHKKKIATQLGMKLVGKVNESKDEVNSKQLANLQRDIKKINKKIKVYISKHPVTKGRLSIELGQDHDDDREIDKINKLLKKHTGDWRTGTMFNESVDEASFTPNSGTMSGGTYGLDKRKYELKRDVKGVQIGNYTNITLPKGTIIYNIPGGVFAHHRSLKSYEGGQNKYFNKPTFRGISVRQKKDTIVSIEKNSKILESVNERINPKFYNARVQWIDPKSKKKFVGDVVRYDNGEYKVNLGKDGRFEKYILAKEKDLKIVSKSKKKTFESVNEAKVKRPVNRWLELKNDETLHPHKKMAMGLKELKYQLAETQKFFNWYNKIKTMNELDSSDYWKRTNKHIYKIKERLINIAKTIQEIEK